MDRSFTYEVGYQEKIHPDPDIDARFHEVALSNCKYGCKIYKDSASEVRVLHHNNIYGCKKASVGWKFYYKMCGFKLGSGDYCMVNRDTPHVHDTSMFPPSVWQSMNDDYTVCSFALGRGQYCIIDVRWPHTH